LRQRSQASYRGWVAQLAEHYPKAYTPFLSPDKVLDFLIHLQTDRKLAGSTVNQALCALRCFFRDHLDLDWNIWQKIKIKRVEPLPHVLTRGEVALLLGTFREGRYRAYFTLVYQCGLRMSEALNIKPTDIKRERLIIRITNGKGGKQRDVPITAELHRRLQNFWKSHRNPHWLFPATGRGWKRSGIGLRKAMGRCSRPMNKSGVWAAMNVAKAECGLSRQHGNLRIHTLRH